MEKVKVTREIADAIEFGVKHHFKDDIVRAYTNAKDWRLVGELKPLRHMPLDRLIKALYIGYEVEPEYKVGDIVVLNAGAVVEILEIKDPSNFIVGYIENTNMYREKISKSDIVRHADKEEKWWASHGREPWELKNNDILNDRQENRTVTIAKVIDKFPAEEITVLFTNGDWESYNNIVEDSDWRVACFADKRLDVKTNE